MLLNRDERANAQLALLELGALAWLLTCARQDRPGPARAGTGSADAPLEPCMPLACLSRTLRAP